MDDSDGSATTQPSQHELDPERLVLVVVGAGLGAEVTDRPIAYGVRERMLTWLGEHFEGEPPCDVVVCTDLWRLNDRRLDDAPTLAIGGPGANALTASLLEEVPGAFVVDDTLSVQLDPAFEEPIALAWGVDVESTARAAQVFCERSLGAFMERATRPWASAM